MQNESVAISLHHLAFGWQKDDPVLSIDKLNIATGDRVFIEGPSGSGKTTLLNLISGVLTPSQGDILVRGQNLGLLSASARDKFRADNLGIIFQQFNLLPYLSVLENVTLACDFSHQRKARLKAHGLTPLAAAKQLLNQLGLTEALFKRPITTLSVGQQQRVAAARALIGSPPILIADEPTSALDAPLRDSFLSLLFEACDKQNTTLLFVSHDPSIAHRFNQTLALQQLNTAVHRGAIQ